MKVDRFLLVLLLMGIFLIPFTYFYLYPSFLQKIQQPSYFGSGISYELTLETDAPIFNATFLLPLPVQEGIPAVGLLKLTESMFSEPGYKVSFVTLEGDQYLRLTAGIIPADQEYQVRYGDRSERIDYDNQGSKVEYKNAEDFPYWINTRQPLGNVTVFFPKSNMSIAVPEPRTYNPGSGIYFNPVVLHYQTKIYAEFDSKTEASVHIRAKLDGYNQWVEEFDAWRGNYYSDSYQRSLYQSADGWYLADGEMKYGSGKYLDGTY